MSRQGLFRPIETMKPATRKPNGGFVLTGVPQTGVLPLLRTTVEVIPMDKLDASTEPDDSKWSGPPASDWLLAVD